MYEVEAAVGYGPTQRTAGHRVLGPPLTAAEREYLDVYAERSHVLDEVAHEAARGRLPLRGVDVREAEHLHRLHVCDRLGVADE
jgi:hypothetical protein